MTFDGLIYSILLVLYGGLRYGKPIPSEMESIEQIEAETGVKIPPRYWDEAIRAIAKRGYAKGFEYDYETKRFFIYDASKPVLTYDGYEFMKQDKFFNPDEVLAELEEKQNKQ